MTLECLVVGGDGLGNGLQDGQTCQSSDALGDAHYLVMTHGPVPRVSGNAR